MLTGPAVAPATTIPAQPPTARISIIIADRNRSFSDALTPCLTPDVGFHVLESCADEAAAVQAIRTRRPQFAIVDARLPGRGFLGLADEASVRLGETRMILMADELPDVLLEQALAIPVAGILLKAEPLQCLVDALVRIARGETTFSENVRVRLDFHPRRRRYEVRQRSVLARFSARQIEVLQQLARGRRVKEVADALQLSEKAVESHKYRIMNRLGIHDRVELALYAVREGLIHA